MKKLTLLPLVCMALCVVPAAVVKAEDDEAQIYQGVEEVIDAVCDYEFEKLADLLDPGSLREFRKVMEVTFERLAETWSDAEVLEIMGLERPPAHSPLTDKELFVLIANKSKELDPTMNGSWGNLPIRVKGTVFADGGDQAHVVYERVKEIASKKSSVDYLQVRTVTFRRVKGKWKLQAIAFVGVIPRVWEEALGAKDVDSKGEKKTGDKSKAKPKAKAK